MIKKKGKFLTFIFSLVPGGGQMYMGFMKEGLSLMSVFAFIIFLGSWLNISPVTFTLPVIWFYSFFDSINKMALSQEELEKQEDKYFFQLDKLPKLNSEVFNKYKMYIALFLIFLGFSVLWKNTFHTITSFLPYYMTEALYRISDRIPQIIVSIFIIYAGVKLINGKKEELNQETYDDEENTEDVTFKEDTENDSREDINNDN